MQDTYDVVVVGSGASGGTLAAHLARAGVSVLVVEGGPRIDTRTDFNTHALPFEFSQRAVPVMKPGKPGFDSPRTCGVGGKTLLWNAVSLRLSQRDFKGASHDGAGVDWPIDYEEIAPYYSMVEREIGVCGNRDALPDLPDGEFLPPAPLKCSDLIVQKGVEKLGLKLIHVRKATLTRATSTRPPCHFCGNCMAGCDVVAKYNSADVHLYPAQRETGKLDILTDSIVYELALEEHTPLVKEVRFLNRETGEKGAVHGHIVALGCACEQSIGLLLMSKSDRFPRGLSNSNGQLGRHFIPHIVGIVDGFLNELIGRPTIDDEGFLDHSYIPSFMHDRARDYPRSFAIQISAHNRRYVPWAELVKGIGVRYKEAVRSRYPAYAYLEGYTEITPNADSYVELDPTAKDQYGLPVVNMHWKLTSVDWKRLNDARKWCTSILRESGAEVLTTDRDPYRAHPLGGCRMGDDPKTSIVDRHCRSHEIPNLYVIDGGVFPSSSEKNPTLTIMALSARAADHISETLRGRAS